MEGYTLYSGLFLWGSLLTLESQNFSPMNVNFHTCVLFSITVHKVLLASAKLNTHLIEVLSKWHLTNVFVLQMALSLAE